MARCESCGVEEAAKSPKAKKPPATRLGRFKISHPRGGEGELTLCKLCAKDYRHSGAWVVSVKS